MTKILMAFAALLIVGGLAYHFAALNIFNVLIPKDAASRLVAQNIGYGRQPRQKLDVYAPTEGTGPWPVIVFVHGGSWQSGSKDPYEFVGRALAAQGFVTMVMSYRLHPIDKYPAFVEDVAMALKWASQSAAEFHGDGTRLFGVGHSAGAYNLAMAVLDQSHAATMPKMSGVVTLAGPFDFVPLDSPVTIEVFGHLSDLPVTQPVNHTTASSPPFLILHGRGDTTVKLRNAEALHRALVAAGASAAIKIYDDVSHVGIMMALAKPLRGRTPVLDEAVAFIRGKSQ